MTRMPWPAWDAARRAADRITGKPAHPSVVQGVLAQWVAENGWDWPPPRRNPGNLARGWAANFPYPFAIQTPNPQPGNPIVTFVTLGGGVDCYAAGIVRFPRYAPAAQHARAGDGLGFAVAVCRAGYGTRESTVRRVYAELERPAAPPLPPLIGGIDRMIRYAHVTATLDHVQLGAGDPLYDAPGGRRITAARASIRVPYVGFTTDRQGGGWRAVLVGTSVSYPDGRLHRTIVYVPAATSEVVP